jgi:tetratricopeptide (TPR) repeat protein
LYNKVGDLYQKVRNVNSAVDIWERAVDRYTDSGFPNNAIALCNKILRSAPGRTHVYLRLAQLMMQRGFVAEAKKNFIEYAERMMEIGKLDEAFKALKQFAELSPEDEDLRAMLYSQLKAAARDDQSKAQLEALMEQAGAGAGDPTSTKPKFKEVDPEYDLDVPPSSMPKGRSDDLIFISLDDDEPGRRSRASQVAPEPIEFETTSLADEEDSAPDSVDILKSDSLQIERTSETDLTAFGEVETNGPVEGLEAEGSFEAPAEEEEIPLLEIEPTALEAEPLASESPGGDEDLSFLTSDAEVAGIADDDGSEDDGFVHRTTTGLEVPELDLGGFDVPTDEELPEAAAVSEDDEPHGETAPSERASAEEETDTPVAESPNHEPYQLEDFDGMDPVEAAALDLPHGGFGSGPYRLPAEPEDAADEEHEQPETEPDAVPASAMFDANTDRDQDDVFGGEQNDYESGLFGDDSPDEPKTGVVEDETIGGDLQFIEPESESESAQGAPAHAQAPIEMSVATEPRTLEELEAALGESPDDAGLRRRYAEALIETGDRDHGLSELDRALVTLEAKGDWPHAASVTDEILRLEPNSVTHHQKQVEYTYRVGDHSRLIGAYLGLGNALFRSGVLDRARSVYERVLELDPDNKAALQALESVMPAKPAGGDGGAASDFIDLGELILGDEEDTRDTRMRVHEEEPTGDEQQDFREMLEQFKRGIEENLDEEDSQAHYDLGVAFKEMGLIDEAIAEFQKALRSLETRLQSAEMLGLCFFDKGQIEVAGTVLRRGIDGDPSSDQEKIGLLYWLGRCEEEQGRSAEAIRHYQRVFAIDIHFLDVGKRVDPLVKATR